MTERLLLRPGSPAKRGASDAGLTLVEMLVVLAIIGIIASVAVLSVGSGSSRSAQVEARLLQSRLQYAADRTMVTDAAIALVPAPDGYRFVEWDERSEAWRDSVTTGLAAQHRLPRGVVLTASDAQPQLLLGAYGGGTGFVLTLAGENRVWNVRYDGVSARASAAGMAAPVS